MTPRRRVPPRVATPLAGIEPVRVGTPHGDVATWRLGDGPAVLLVHGRDDDTSLWGPMIEAVAGAGHAVVAFDLPAHGLSGGERCLGWEVTDAVHAVAAAAGPVVAAVGHSVGAGGIAGAVSEGLALGRCVFLAPPLGRGGRWRRVAEREGMAPEVADRAQAMYERGLAPGRVGWTIHDALERLGGDVLVVVSADDERMPVEGARGLATSAPDARVEVLTGPGHRAVARDPAALASTVAFLRGLRYGHGG